MKINLGNVHNDLTEWQQGVLSISDDASFCGEYTDEQAQELASKAVELAGSYMYYEALRCIEETRRNHSWKRRFATVAIPLMAGASIAFSITFLLGA